MIIFYFFVWNLKIRANLLKNKEKKSEKKGGYKYQKNNIKLEKKGEYKIKWIYACTRSEKMRR